MAKSKIVKNESEVKVEGVISEIEKLLRANNCRIIANPSIELNTQRIVVTTTVVDMDLAKKDAETEA